MQIIHTINLPFPTGTMGFKTSTISRIALSLAVSHLPSSVLAASRADYIGNAVNASDILNQKWYDQANGQWQGLWWNSANALTAIADMAWGSPSGESIETDTYVGDPITDTLIVLPFTLTCC